MRRRRRPKHTVKASVKILSLTKAGSSIELQVYAEQKKIGTVIIGRGSLTWIKGRGHQKVSGIRRSWSELADWFERA